MYWSLAMLVVLVEWRRLAAWMVIEALAAMSD